MAVSIKCNGQSAGFAQSRCSFKCCLFHFIIVPNFFSFCFICRCLKHCVTRLLIRKCASPLRSVLSPPPTRLVVTSVNDPLRNQLPGKEKCTHASLNFFAAYVHCPFFIFPIIFLFSFCLWHLLFVCVFLTYVLCAFFPRVSGIFLIFLPASSSIHHHCATFLSLVFSMAFILLTHFAYFSPSLPPRKKNKTEIVLIH